ncbi:hypothetical protein FACS1894187_25480 [Synergistales bacterium]|nr:hypothetical protein FACS1894187_25480 [Synergistales bacterium]
MSDFSGLENSMDMWSYLSFEPWEACGGLMRGVSRRITLVKDGFLGEVAKYYALDYIVWTHNDAQSIEYLLSMREAVPDVVTQRFVLVGSSRPASGEREAKSFAFGLKGFLELYSYTPTDKTLPASEENPSKNYHRKISDLVPSINLAWNRRDHKRRLE